MLTFIKLKIIPYRVPGCKFHKSKKVFLKIVIDLINFKQGMFLVGPGFLKFLLSAMLVASYVHVLVSAPETATNQWRDIKPV